MNYKLSRLKVIFITLIILVLFLITMYMLQIYWGSFNDEVEKFKYTDAIEYNVILWWTSFTGTKGELKSCGKNTCYFTEDRNFQKHNNSAILFYGSSFHSDDIPYRRNGQIWSLLHEESPRNNPIFLNEEFLSLFNYTSTFDRNSNFPLTTMHLDSMDLLAGKDLMATLSEKNELLNKLAPVLYIQSDCSTPIDRDSYVLELMKHIKVDSYGTCLNNRKLPTIFEDMAKTFETTEFFQFVSQYKFTIAIENTICNDYVTEKLWRPLIVGSIPIYLGSPSVKDWLPNNTSAILVSDFSSPEKLADFIKVVNEDDDLYQSYMRHKEEGGITNNLLKETLKKRYWDKSGNKEKTSFVRAFECFLCEHINEYKSNNNFYNCPKPVSALSKVENQTNWWGEVYSFEICEGKVIYSMVLDGISNFTKKYIFERVSEFYSKGYCKK